MDMRLGENDPVVNKMFDEIRKEKKNDFGTPIKGVMIGRDIYGLPIIQMLEDVKKGEWFLVGVVPAQKIGVCKKCNGTGQELADPNQTAMYQPCSLCHGAGQVIIFDGKKE